MDIIIQWLVLGNYYDFRDLQNCFQGFLLIQQHSDIALRFYPQSDPIRNTRLKSKTLYFKTLWSFAR